MKKWLFTVYHSSTVKVEAETAEAARIIAVNTFSRLDKDEDTYSELEEMP